MSVPPGLIPGVVGVCPMSVPPGLMLGVVEVTPGLIVVVMPGLVVGLVPGPPGPNPGELGAVGELGELEEEGWGELLSLLPPHPITIIEAHKIHRQPRVDNHLAITSRMR